MIRTTLSQGYGQDDVSWEPMGGPRLTGDEVSYAVKPITCN